MKLLLAARRFPPDVYSGTETVFEALYAEARRRNEVRLVAGWRRARELVPPEAVAVSLRGLGKPMAWAAMAGGILREAMRFRPDAILSNSVEVPPTGIPTACIVHDLNFGGASEGWESALKRRFYGLRGRGLDRLIAVSDATAATLAALGVPGDRITVIQNGVDLERFRPTPPPADDGVVRFVYAARVLPGKGQHHAIDAIARLRGDHKRRAHLTLVGAVADPVYLDQIRVQAYNQPVSFALDVPDVAPYYAASDVVLFPTVMAEGFGFSAVEGMACGRPVIWFDQPAVREATGGLGVAVDRGDIDGLRAAMMRLMDDPAARTQLGAEGRAWCEARYAWSAVWAKYEAVLAEISA